eukprot:gene5412-6751_t
MSTLLKLLPGSFVSKLQKSSWVEYRKMGLFYADLYNNTPVMQEVYRRCPPELLIKRDRRLAVAIDLDVKKKLLPEEEWSNIEEDIKYTELIEKMAERVEKEEDLRKAFRD